MGALNIAIEIAAKDSGASALINSIKGGLSGLGDLAGGALTLGLGAAAAGIAGLGAGLGLAVSEAMGAQEVMSQTEAVIKSTGGAAGMTADAIADLAGSLSQNSRFADDAIQEGENLLLTFTNIGSDVFPDATQAMVDMATAMKTDAKSGAIQLGKALNDPVAGISALSRVGVSFTEDQKKMIEQMVKAGDVAGAQKIILAELNKEFGGSAAASAATFAGKLDVIKNQALNVAEAIGGPLITIGSSFIDKFLTPAMPLIIGIGDALTDFLAGVMGQTDPTERFLSLWEDVSDLFGPDVADAVTGVAEAIGWVFDSIGQGKGAGDILAGLADFSWDDFLPPWLASLISGTITNLQTFGATVQQVFTAFQPVVAAFSDLWAGTLAPAFAQVFGDVTANAPSMQQIFDGAMTGIVAAAQGLADFLTNTAIPAIKSMVDWFMENWPTIKAKGEEVMNGLQTAIQTVADGIRSFWGEWGDDILGLFQGAVDGVTNAFNLFKLPFEGKWYEFGEGLRKGFDDAWEKIKGLVTDALTWFTQQDWGEIGTNILQGIANGITAAASLIKDAALAAAQAAYEAVKGFFGIHSPSTLMEYLGEFIPAGLARGITNNAMLPAYAAADMSLSAYQGAAMGAGTSYGGITIHVDARGSANEAAAKRAAKEGVREALREAGINADQRRRVGG